MKKPWEYWSELYHVSTSLFHTGKKARMKVPKRKIDNKSVGKLSFFFKIIVAVHGLKLEIGK